MKECHRIKPYRTFQLAGFIDGMKRFDRDRFHRIPIIAAWPTSGDAIAAEIYQHFSDYEKTKGNRSNRRRLMSMHGAMGVEGMRDPESTLLGEVRKIVDDTIPIGSVMICTLISPRKR